MNNHQRFMGLSGHVVKQGLAALYSASMMVKHLSRPSHHAGLDLPGLQCASIVVRNFGKGKKIQYEP